MNPTEAELRRGARIVFWICYLLLALPVGALLLAGTFAFHGPARSALYGTVVLVGPLVGYRRILAALLGGAAAAMSAHDFVYGGPRGVTGTLHRRGCRMLAGKQSAGFPLGDGKTPAQFRDELAASGETREQTRFCRVCLPEVQPLPEWQEPTCPKPGCGKPYSDPVHIFDHHFWMTDG